MGEPMATREAYGRALVRLGAENKDIVVLDADLSKSTRTELFAREFPERFFNIGIAEQNMLGTAAGLSLAGKVPFVSSFAIFATGRAFEQVRNSVAYPALNVKIAASHAGISVGEDGASHQSIEDLALMRVLPNMGVIVPADAVQTARAVSVAAAYRGPIYLRLARPVVPCIYPDDYEFGLGRADVLRDGRTATIIACGIMVARAIEAADLLARRGIAVRVINMATIKPLDEAAVILAARETGAVVTAEEHSIIGGLGGAVAEVLAENCPVPLQRVGIRDTFGESGRPEELMEKYGLTASHIAEAVNRVLEAKK